MRRLPARCRLARRAYNWQPIRKKRPAPKNGNRWHRPEAITAGRPLRGRITMAPRHRPTTMAALHHPGRIIMARLLRPARTITGAPHRPERIITAGRLLRVRIITAVRRPGRLAITAVLHRLGRIITAELLLQGRIITAAHRPNRVTITAARHRPAMITTVGLPLQNPGTMAAQHLRPMTTMAALLPQIPATTALPRPLLRIIMEGPLRHPKVMTVVMGMHMEWRWTSRG